MLLVACSEDNSEMHSGPEGLGEPLWTLSEANGVPLFLVRAARMTRNSGVLIGDSGNHRLLWVSREGGAVRVLGAGGRGPGEFVQIDWVEEVGDSIWAYDPETNRVTVGTSDVWAARTFRPDPNLGFAVPIGVTRNRKLVAVKAQHMTELVGEGLLVDTVQILELGPEGLLVRTVGEQAFASRYVRRDGIRTTVITPPFSPRARIVTWASNTCGVFLTDSVIRCTSESGEITPLSVLHGSGRELLGEDVDRFWKALAESGQSARRDVLERLRLELPFPSRFPVVAHLFVDRDGRLWVGEYVPPEAATRIWEIHQTFEESERLSLPQSLVPMDAQGDLFLGLYKDSLGVETLGIYPFRVSE